MDKSASLLIRDAELLDARRAYVRLVGGRVVAVRVMEAAPGEPVIDARGGLLLPGLHDHHLHLAATAAARASIACGPPDVTSPEELAVRLAQPGQGWLRGVGYYESVAGMLDRRWLDQVAPDRPVRIQHRSGRMWFLNSAGLDLLLASGLPSPPGLERESGRLFDADVWLRRALGGRSPSLDALGADLARLGVTGVTDMTPANGPAERDWLDGEVLPQTIMIAGRPELADCAWSDRIMLGPVKIHLHEADLIPHDDFVARVRAAHRQDRGVAVNCVTEVELVYTLAALEAAGVHPADRIEHVSVTPDPLLAQIAAMAVPVVVQPLFVKERGDAYRRDIPEVEWPHLYRRRAFIDAGVIVARSSDAPYVDINPWAGMRAAVDRRTSGGALLSAREALTPEQAPNLYLADPADLRRTRAVTVGAPADLCLLDGPWAQARETLSADHVRLTMIGGDIVYQALA